MGPPKELKQKRAINNNKTTPRCRPLRSLGAMCIGSSTIGVFSHMSNVKLSCSPKAKSSAVSYWLPLGRGEKSTLCPSGDAEIKSKVCSVGTAKRKSAHPSGDAEKKSPKSVPVVGWKDGSWSSTTQRFKHAEPATRRTVWCSVWASKHIDLTRAWF